MYQRNKEIQVVKLESKLNNHECQDETSNSNGEMSDSESKDLNYKPELMIKSEKSIHLDPRERDDFETITKKSRLVTSNEKETAWINDLKTAISKQNNQKHKVFLLTTIPDMNAWIIRETSKIFGVSRWMVKKAQNLRKSSDYGTFSAAKTGNRTSDEVLEIIKKILFVR